MNSFSDLRDDSFRPLLVVEVSVRTAGSEEWPPAVLLLVLLPFRINMATLYFSRDNSNNLTVKPI